ncbi:MAG: hypothetical protein V3S49_01720 [Thermodesulfobacteriota bacterium]
MVEKIICSTCNEVSYTITNERNAPCPYCDFEMIWKNQDSSMIGINNQRTNMMLTLNDGILFKLKKFKSIKEFKSNTE